MNFLKYLSLIIVSILHLACNNGPKVITNESTADDEIKSSGIFSEENTNSESSNINSSSITDELHTVIVNEKLPAAKYVYLKVTEAGEQYWIATRNKEITIGKTYYYKRGLLKTNFESKEYNRVFEKIYLVSSLIPENHMNTTGAITTENSIKETSTNNKKETTPTQTEKITPLKGSMSIAELVADPDKYNGKTIQLTGKCVKINPNIMDRNWIHLQDGSKDDYDLVITSNTFVLEGKIITIRALVSINRDFGSGYRYDLILEDGIILE